MAQAERGGVVVAASAMTVLDSSEVFSLFRSYVGEVDATKLVTAMIHRGWQVVAPADHTRAAMSTDGEGTNDGR